MLGVLYLLVGVLEVTVPERLISFWTDLAFEDGEDLEVRPWVITLARLEGVVFLYLALRRFRRSRGSESD